MTLSNITEQQQNKNFIYCEEIIDLISCHGDKALCFSFLSKKLNMPLATLYDLFPSIPSLISTLQSYWQKKFLLSVEDIRADLLDPDLTAKEIILELSLLRLETLSPYKKACKTLWTNQTQDMQASSDTLKTFFNSINWILELSGLDLNSPYGLLRSKVLGFVYLNTLKVWFEDISEDMTPTSAILNERLDQAEKLFPFIWKRG